MYIPAHFAAGPGAVHDLLTRPSAANLIAMTSRGLLATLLPFIHEPSIGGHGALHGHPARNNSQWSELVLGESLGIIQGADAYSSPSWYAPKAEHGRVVPTWNCSTAHVYGKLVIHDGPVWLGSHARRLTDLNEARSEHPWTVDDAPKRYISGQLRASVGIELLITRIETKSQLSQNRSDTDGVVAGLNARGQAESAADVARARRQDLDLKTGRTWGIGRGLRDAAEVPGEGALEAASDMALTAAPDFIGRGFGVAADTLVAAPPEASVPLDSLRRPGPAGPFSHTDCCARTVHTPG